MVAQVNSQNNDNRIPVSISQKTNNSKDNQLNQKRDVRNKRKLDYQESHQQNIQTSKKKSNSIKVDFLRDDQSIIEYKIVGSTINITVTEKYSTKTKTIFFPEDLTTQIDNLLECLTNYKTAINSPSKSYQEFIESASKLFEYLILPIKKEITDHDLILILDGPLHTIPFEVLLEKKPVLNKRTPVDYKNLDYFVKKRKISYTYSYTFLNIPVKENNGGFLGFAPNFSTDTLINTDLNSTRNFNTLQFSFKEIDVIEKLFSNAIALKGEEATERAFYELSEDFNVLHFSTHAIVDHKAPYNSHLVLSNSTDENTDGYLHINELSKMNLSANMAVLAACNTGNGKTTNKHGMISLGSSFLNAGCSSVVTSLWLAHDESTSLIMEYFYRFLSLGLTKDEALQRAKLKYLKIANPLTFHPFYWANFVVVGNTQPLKNVADPVKKKFRNWLYIFAIIGFGLGVILIKKEIL